MATAIFYASSTENTVDVASKIGKQLGDIEFLNGANKLKMIFCRRL